MRPLAVVTTADACRPVRIASRVTPWTSRLVAPPSGVESVSRNAPPGRSDITMISVPMRSAKRRTAALRSAADAGLVERAVPARGTSSSR